MKTNAYFLKDDNVLSQEDFKRRFSQVANTVDKEGKQMVLIGQDNEGDEDDEQIKEDAQDNLKAEEINNQNEINNGVIANENNNNLNENNNLDEKKNNFLDNYRD